MGHTLNRQSEWRHNRKQHNNEDSSINNSSWHAFSLHSLKNSRHNPNIMVNNLNLTAHFVALEALLLVLALSSTVPIGQWTSTWNLRVVLVSEHQTGEASDIKPISDLFLHHDQIQSFCEWADESAVTAVKDHRNKWINCKKKNTQILHWNTWLTLCENYLKKTVWQ